MPRRAATIKTANDCKQSSVVKGPFECPRPPQIRDYGHEIRPHAKFAERRVVELIIGQVLCRYWIHQQMLLTASSPIRKSVRLNRFQCSAIYFLHLCSSWHVTSIFASSPKTNVVPVGLIWYYPQLPSQADHEFVCNMLHTCCKIISQISLWIYLYSEFNSYETYYDIKS